MDKVTGFWRRRGRLGKSLVVIVAALIVLAVAGSLTNSGDDSDDNTAATGTTGLSTAVADDAGDPLTCLEDGEDLSNAEARGSDFWRATHGSPFYQVSVDLLASKVDAEQLVQGAVDVYAAQAGRYAVTGPARSTTPGSALSAEDGDEAGAVVQEVATCLRGG